MSNLKQRRVELMEQQQVADAVSSFKAQGVPYLSVDQDFEQCETCFYTAVIGSIDPRPCCGKYSCYKCLCKWPHECPYCRRPTSSNTVIVLKLLRKYARKGKAWAQVDLFRSLVEVGRVDEARHWIELAAKQGDLQANWHLGECYKQGILGFPKSHDRAIDLYEYSASRGHALSQNSLFTSLYIVGKTQEAFQWGRFAADQGRPVITARMTLAVLIKDKFPRKKIYWCKQALKQLDLEVDDTHRIYEGSLAQFELGKAMVYLASLNCTGRPPLPCSVLGYDRMPEAYCRIQKAIQVGFRISSEEDSELRSKNSELRSEAQGKLAMLKALGSSCCSVCKKDRSQCDLLPCSRCRYHHYCGSECRDKALEVSSDRNHRNDCFPPPNCCTVCGIHEESLLYCAKCQFHGYCSKECQKIDWNRGHKKNCYGNK